MSPDSLWFGSNEFTAVVRATSQLAEAWVWPLLTCRQFVNNSVLQPLQYASIQHLSNCLEDKSEDYQAILCFGMYHCYTWYMYVWAVLSLDLGAVAIGLGLWAVYFICFLTMVSVLGLGLTFRCMFVYFVFSVFFSDHTVSLVVSTSAVKKTHLWTVLLCWVEY